MSKEEWRSETWAVTRLAVIILVGMQGVFILAPKLEGRFSPVVSVAELISYQNIADSAPAATVWTATAEKYRECAFERIEWWWGERDSMSVRVDARFTDPPQVRRAGTLEWTGLVVGLPAEEVRTRSFADVLHRCGARPWLTRTRFYDPPET